MLIIIYSLLLILLLPLSSLLCAPGGNSMNKINGLLCPLAFTWVHQCQDKQQQEIQRQRGKCSFPRFLLCLLAESPFWRSLFLPDVTSQVTTWLSLGPLLPPSPLGPEDCPKAHGSPTSCPRMIKPDSNHSTFSEPSVSCQILLV